MKSAAAWAPVLGVAIGLVASSCASSPSPVRTQAYAALRNERMFEFEFPVVWKGIEAAFKNFRVAERDPEEVDAPGLKKLAKRMLETDWTYSQSRDKYQEYVVNGTPRRQPLQIRFKQRVEASRALGGTSVRVLITEEIERLRPDGSSAGFSSVEKPDSGRASETLDKIQLAILQAPLL